MTQPQALRSSDATINPAIGGDGKAQARQVLSTYAVDTAIKDSVSGGKTAKSNDVTVTGSDKNSVKSGMEHSKFGIDKSNGKAEADAVMAKKWQPITDKDREAAKERVGKGLSDLIPEKDRKDLKAVTDSLIDGKLDKLTETLKGLSDDPARMEKILKAAQEQLAKNGSDLKLQVGRDGNVLVYHESGDTALSVNAKTGEASLHPIERQSDGSVVLKPGEIINRTPGEQMQTMGDKTVRDIIDPWGFGNGPFMPKFGNIDKSKDVFSMPPGGVNKLAPAQGVKPLDSIP